MLLAGTEPKRILLAAFAEYLGKKDGLDCMVVSIAEVYIHL